MRVLSFIAFVVSFMWGAQFVHPDFSSCYKKTEKSFFYHEGYTAYPVSSKLAILYAPDADIKNYIKYDPFLGLYLVKNSSKTPLKIKDISNVALGDWIAAANDESLYIGNYAKKMDGFEKGSIIATSTQDNAVIMCLCCEIYGIALQGGEFIDSSYIKHFISTSDTKYGSLGVRLKQKGGHIVVDTVDPFNKGGMFQKGDLLLKFDGKTTGDISKLKKMILFSKESSSKAVRIQRGSNSLELDAKISPRFGGFRLSDTFLERFGLFFDNKLNLIKAGSFGLKENDRLLQINGKDVKSQSEARALMSKSKAEKIRLLFDRDDFEFFVEIDI